jgi:hypothetical protein
VEVGVTAGQGGLVATNLALSTPSAPFQVALPALTAPVLVLPVSLVRLAPLGTTATPAVQPVAWANADGLVPFTPPAGANVVGYAAPDAEGVGLFGMVDVRAP